MTDSIVFHNDNEHFQNHKVMQRHCLGEAENTYMILWQNLFWITDAKFHNMWLIFMEDITKTFGVLLWNTV